MKLWRLTLPLLLGVAVMAPTGVSAFIGALSSGSGAESQLEARRGDDDDDDDDDDDNNDSDCLAERVLVGPVCIDLL